MVGNEKVFKEGVKINRLLYDLNTDKEFFV